MAFRWQTPYEWLAHACQKWSEEQLRIDLLALAIQADSDQLQDLYQDQMNDDGYFDPVK